MASKAMRILRCLLYFACFQFSQCILFFIFVSFCFTLHFCTFHFNLVRIFLMNLVAYFFFIPLSDRICCAYVLCCTVFFAPANFFVSFVPNIFSSFRMALLFADTQGTVFKWVCPFQKKRNFVYVYNFTIVVRISSKKCMRLRLFATMRPRTKISWVCWNEWKARK